MKKRFLITLMLFSLVLLLSNSAFAKHGLLIVAHGSPSKSWNKKVVNLYEEVNKLVKKDNTFEECQYAFLEFAQPDVPTVLAEMEKNGCDRIIAFPLFIAPSGHTHFDLPTVLGTYYDPDIVNTIKEEGGSIAKTKVPITQLSTLSYGDFLSNAALKDIESLSKNPDNEALVILAHGDPGHKGLIDAIMEKIISFCKNKTGISYADWAYVEVGQEYESEGIKTILKATELKKRVLVVGLYVGLSPENIHKNFVKGLFSKKEVLQDPIAEKDVVFSKNTVLSDPSLANWILTNAKNSVH